MTKFQQHLKQYLLNTFQKKTYKVSKFEEIFSELANLPVSVETEVNPRTNANLQSNETSTRVNNKFAYIRGLFLFTSVDRRLMEIQQIRLNSTRQ